MHYRTILAKSDEGRAGIFPKVGAGGTVNHVSVVSGGGSGNPFAGLVALCSNASSCLDLEHFGSKDQAVVEGQDFFNGIIACNR